MERTCRNGHVVVGPGRCAACRRASRHRYERGEAARQRRRRYEATDKSRERHRRFDQSERGRLRKVLYESSLKGQLTRFHNRLASDSRAHQATYQRAIEELEQ